MTLFEKKFQTTTDRFGNADSALLFKGGYAVVPPGVYFDAAIDGFTVMLWLKLLNTNQKAERNQTIIEFGNGFLIDSFSLSSEMKRNLVSNCISVGSTVACSEYLDMANRWIHITIVFLINGETKLYTDGHLLVSIESESQTFEKVVRGSNFIGYGSNDPEFLFAELNELKIFNRGLSSAEINHDVQLIGSRFDSQKIQLDYAGETNIEGRFQTGSVDEFQLFTANIGIPHNIVLNTRGSVDLKWNLYKVNYETLTPCQLFSLINILLLKAIIKDQTEHSSYLYFFDEQDLSIRQQTNLHLVYTNYNQHKQPVNQQLTNNWRVQIDLGTNELAKYLTAKVYIQIDNKSILKLTNLSQALEDKETIFQPLSSAYFTINYTEKTEEPPKKIQIILECLQKGSWLLKNVILTKLATSVPLTFQCNQFMECLKPGQKISEEFNLLPEGLESKAGQDMTSLYLKIILPPVLVISSTACLLLLKVFLRKFKKLGRKKNKKSDTIVPVPEPSN